MIRRSRIASGIVPVLVSGCGFATAEHATPHRGDASVDRVRTHVEFLASDEMRGRQSGTPEYDRAAQYIQTHLGELSLDPLFANSYKQPFTVQTIRFTGNGSLVFSRGGNQDRYAELEDLAFVGVNADHAPKPTPLGLAYVGLGIHEPEVGWDDYAEIDLTNRCALLTFDTPAELVQDLPAHLIAQYTNPSTGPSAKAWAALRHGAACIIAFPSSYAPPGLLAPMRAPAILRQQFVLTEAMKDWVGPIAVVSAEVGARLLGTERPTLQTGSARLLEGSVSFDISWTSASTVRTANIGATIRGSDPQLRDQVIVLSAHLDGQGMQGQQVLNSANDNASSVAALLEAAGLLAAAAPRRTVHLLFTTMEEGGLLGSKHFVENPPAGAANFRLNVNMEMIGKPRRSGGTHDYRVSSRVAPDLESLVREVERGAPAVRFDYSHRSDDDGRRIFRNADHVNFFLRGIPTLYFYGGGEDYHQPSDDPDGVNFEKVATMADLLVAVVEATDRLEHLPGWQ